MQIKIASHSGFCFGVKRAIGIAGKTLQESNGRGPIYSLGPIIHNPQVVDSLLKKGLQVINGINKVKKGTVIISSHGAPMDLIQKIKKNITLINATCPFVKYAHDIVRDLQKDGYRIDIIGDKKHPEVKALTSLAQNSGAAGRVTGKKIGIISQTTQNKNNYIAGIMDVLRDDFSEARIFNTICKDTFLRQKSCRRLLEECDVMIVVGGKNSANTRRLWEICKESGVDSCHIETELELEKEYFIGRKCAGVVSGASTPDSMVKKVAGRIKQLTSRF